MARKTYTPTLIGPEKVAVLMICLGENLAGKILASLSDKEIQTIGSFMSMMESVEPQTIDVVVKEFYDALMSGGGGMLSGGRDYLRKMLEKNMDPAKVNEFLSKMTSATSGDQLGGGLEAIKHLDTKTVAAFLRNEYPQTIAIILAHLDPYQSAEILKLLPERFRSEIVFRMATMERVSPAIVSDLDQALAAEFQSASQMEGSRLGGVDAVAELVNHLDHNMETAILGEIESTHPELAEEIRSLMFVIEDLVDVDDRGMQTILKEVPKEDLVLALKTVSDALKSKIYKNLSRRAAEMLKDDLESAGPVKLSEVEKAQQNILRLVKKMEEEGKVVLAGGGEKLV
jgi:flagellar motor switch protein FliG